MLGAEYMNEKHFYSQLGDFEKSKKGYNKIKELTDIYNMKMSDGKWNGMMCMNLRKRPVFCMPVSNSIYKSNIVDKNEPKKIISVEELKFDTKKMCLLPGLGVDSVSLSWKNFTDTFSNNSNALKDACASICVNLPEGKCIIELICLPTHSINEMYRLRIAISINNQIIDIVNVDTPSDTKEWSMNVLRCFASARTEFSLNEESMIVLKLSLLEPGIVLSKIIIY